MLGRMTYKTLSKVNILLLTGYCFWLLSCTPVQEQPKQTLFSGTLNLNGQSQSVLPGQRVSLPVDHGSHPEYAIEWWYLTANLFDQSGQHYPLQWTLFRFRSGAASSTWYDGNQFMAHGKLMTQDSTWFAEKFARGGVGNVNVGFDDLGNHFSAYLDDWRWQATGPDLLPAQLRFSLADNVSVDLSLHSTKPYVLNGVQGYSVKHPTTEHASLYYSQPFIELTGTLTLPDRTVEVGGQGWFDHEWSAQLSDELTTGWDWFSLHLNDGSKLMMFRVRHASSNESWFGSYVSSSGDKTTLEPTDIRANVVKISTIENKQVPLNWTISVRSQDIDIAIAPFKPDQFNDGFFSYYEGAVIVSGSHSGVGFIELTGY